MDIFPEKGWNLRGIPIFALIYSNSWCQRQRIIEFGVVTFLTSSTNESEIFPNLTVWRSLQNIYHDSSILHLVGTFTDKSREFSFNSYPFSLDIAE